MRVLLVLLLAAAPLPAAYRNLIATSDGNAVYFEAATGPVTNTWYVARAGGSGVSVEAVARPVADIDGTGAVRAWSTLLTRYCGFAGSTCFLADHCQASFGIDGPGYSTGNNGSQTLVRLDRGGGLAWIEQSSCKSLGSGPPLLNGLYEPGTLRPIAASGGAKLASQQYGRRVLTDGRQALTLSGPQLQWIDAAGAHPIRNVNGVFEAVTDAAGRNVVYAETEGGELHWLTGPDWLGARDEDLHLQGSAPALTPDGTALLFLTAGGSLVIYTRATGLVSSLTSGTYTAFTIAADVVFAAAADGRLVRISLTTGVATEWLAPFPAIRSIDAQSRAGFVETCPLICYALQDFGTYVDHGMIVIFHGDSLGQTGWRVRSAGVETALVPVADDRAWFQVPAQLPRTGDLQTLEIVNPGHPLRYGMQIAIQGGIPVCLATAHQDFTRAVTAEDPAAIGEVVHVFLTGLQGTETFPDGVPNPADRLIPIANAPPFANRDALEPVFFGLAPGLLGLQQLDLRVRGNATAIFDTPHALRCW